MTIITRRVHHWFSLAAVVLIMGGCSMGQVVVRTSMPLMEGSIDAMNRETDLEFAKAAIPANLKMLEGMIVEDPGNATLRTYAAQGLYGYSFAFVEHASEQRAGALYKRCFDQGATGLALLGLEADPEKASHRELEAALTKLNHRAVPALFWTASCWAKWIDMNRDDPRAIAKLGRAAALMERVLALEPDFYYGSAYAFFGVYYGSRPAMLGGDLEKSAEYFAEARAVTDGKLLLIDVLRAEYLARQQLDREAFHNSLTRVLATPVGSFPEMGFANQMARARAERLLAHEADWF